MNLKPFSRRTNRLACRRSFKTCTFGVPNDAFLLDDLPSSSCRKSHVATDDENDAMTGAARTCDTDDDQSVINRRSSSYVALSTTDSGRRTSTAGYDADCNTTCVVVERSASECDFDDNEQLVSNIAAQQPAAPASTEMTSAELTSTT